MAYTNSSLVTYKRLSTKHGGQRTHDIDTITPHVIVGQWTAKQGCDYFATIDRDASCNYVVGKDGSIGLCVEEKNRSFCSSNSTNDNRAVTIEIASDTKHPYAITAAAEAALIKLCVDICKRNGIKELKWSTNKSDRVNHKDGCNITVHRDYRPDKACPGDYVYNRLGDIAKKVNAILNGEKAESKPATSTSSTSSTSTATSKKVNVTYAVQIEGGKVLPSVKNLTDYAGIENKKITGIAMKVDRGSIKYQVHVLGGDWLPWVTEYNWKDHNNGYAGNGRPIDAIRVYYNTPSDLANKGDYREAKYHVSPIGSNNYYDWQLDDVVNKSKNMDGYAGAFGKAIDKVQIDIV